MEKYAKLMKGLEVCAGPDCCKDGCPYYGKTTGAMTCRARLLMDARIAIDNEQALAESADEHIVSLNKDIDDLEAANNTYRDERDKLAKENNLLHERCTVLQNEINALVLKMGGKYDGKTDRPSVDEAMENLAREVTRYRAEAAYARGKADAMAAIVERCSFGGGARHE